MATELLLACHWVYWRDLWLLPMRVRWMATELLLDCHLVHWRVLWLVPTRVKWWVIALDCHLV